MPADISLPKCLPFRILGPGVLSRLSHLVLSESETDEGFQGFSAN